MVPSRGRRGAEAVVLLAVLLGPAASAQDFPLRGILRPRNIILIGWDGAQRDHLKECLSRDELPNLADLSSAGRMVAIDILRTTDTTAGWAQILTGYNPEKTGAFSNGRYQAMPPGYTLIERLESHFGPSNFVTTVLMAKKGNLTASPGTPFFYAGQAADVYLSGLNTDEAVGTLALQYLDRYKDGPFFFFVHFSETDASGHAYGEDSKPYNDALISADTWLGRIMDKLLALGIDGQTLIYVTADHGFDEGQKSHADAPYVFLASNDPFLWRAGDRADIAPTILLRFGLDLGQFMPELDGHPLSLPYIPPIW